MKNAWPGAIVLMHDGGGDRSQTVEALKAALPYLKSQGYRFVTMDELLGYRSLNLASAARRTKASFDLLRDRSPRDVVPLATNIIETTCFLNIDIAIVSTWAAHGATVQKEGSAVLHGR